MIYLYSIIEGFFFTDFFSHSRQAIVWEHKQAKALFNILADNLENIFKTIENTNNDLKEF